MTRAFRAVTLGIAAAACAALPAMVQAASGQITFLTGEVAVTRSGQRLTPTRGFGVNPGDVINTGANGMVQLTMVDQARLSLRPNTQFLIERYPDKPDSQEGALVSLLRGTLRTFTGLIASSNRDKFMMKTRVATVGIRGSGNILYACEGSDCDPSVAGEGRGDGGAITVNHTIEGSHSVTNVREGVPGMPAQQGGAETLITGPGQTVLVQGFQPPRYIPTPRFIADAATNMTGSAAKASSAAQASAATQETRNFAPSDPSAVQTIVQPPAALTSNVTTRPPIDTEPTVLSDPLNLRDVIISIGSPFAGQALAGDVDIAGNTFHGYRSYPSLPGAVQPAITGGNLVDANVVNVAGQSIALGRWENASLGFFGPGSGSTIPGSIHWIVGPSGYPPYLSDVLTGTATYTLAASTSPTNQNNTPGTLGSATLNVNFSNRTLSLALNVLVPGASGGQWQISADNVALSLNQFFASTSDNLVILNGSGQSSRTNSNLTGSVQGSFVGSNLSAAILGYGISDLTSSSASNYNFVSGVAAFAGPAQNGAASYREGRVSDPSGTLIDFIRTYGTTDRPDEVVADDSGRVTSFTAPFAHMGSHATYSIGTAQVVQAGFDPATGMVWGRWSGGVATISSNGQTSQLFLNSSESLHYIFAGTQSGPVALPQTGTATYDVIGSTNPTDANGHVGTLNTATLNANFSNRTVDASVNLGINGQTWNGSASGMAIYRDQYFSAFSGTPIPGVPNPAPLNITCSPSCGQNASGSFDGFFTGRTGQGAGMMFNLGGNQGAVAFGRRGG